MSSPAPEPGEVEASTGLAALRTWCGWHIWPSRPDTLEVESDGGDVLFLPSLHVTEVNGVRDEAGDDVTGWRLRRPGFLRGSWQCDELYAVDVVHGYQNMPAELLGLIEQIDKSGVGRLLVAESSGPFSESYATGSDLESLPISVRSIVSRYRISGSV